MAAITFRTANAVQNNNTSNKNEVATRTSSVAQERISNRDTASSDQISHRVKGTGGCEAFLNFCSLICAIASIIISIIYLAR